MLATDTQKRLDASLYQTALARPLRPETPHETLGAVLATSVMSGTGDQPALIRALHGNFIGAPLDETARIGILRGMLNTAPQLLWLTPGMLDEVDDFLQALGEDDFMALLPHLRLAFTAHNPRETDRLAELLWQLYGTNNSRFSASVHDLSADDMARGLPLDAALRAELLADWVAQ